MQIRREHDARFCAERRLQLADHHVRSSGPQRSEMHFWLRWNPMSPELASDGNKRGEILNRRQQAHEQD